MTELKMMQSLDLKRHSFNNSPMNSLRHSFHVAPPSGYDYDRKDDMEFERQMEEISDWLENWDHKQRCQILEKLLQQSSYSQFQFLFTVLQPSLHRDFMYTAQTRFPHIDFTPVSTYTSRAYKNKVRALRNKGTVHRIKSAYIQLDDEVRAWLTENSTKLPHISRDNKHDQNVESSYKNLRSSLRCKKSDRSPSPLHNTTLSPNRDKTRQNVIIPRHKQEVNDNNCSSVRSVITTPSTIDSCLSKQQDNNNNSKNTENHKTGKTAFSVQNKKRVRIKSVCLSEEAKILLHWYTHEWKDKRKNEFLHKFLLLLDSRQLFFLSSFLTVKQHKDFLALLPEKISLKILSYLNPKELLQARRVSKTWRRLADNNDIWKAQCSEVKVEVPADPVWKDIYRDNMYLRFNWDSGICHTVDLKGHTENVLSVIFDKKRVVSGSLDKTIKVWSIKSGDLLNTLKGHTKGVWCLNFFTDNLLVSGSYDCTIKIWNLRLGTTARTLLGHEGPIWAMVRHDNILVSASQDKTARVWDIGRCLLITVLNGHNAAVFSVDMNEDGTITLTGSADRSVRIWETMTGTCRKVVWVSPSTSIMSVSYSQGYFSCCYGETICLYRVEGAKLINTYLEHHKRVESIKLKITYKDKKKPEGVIVSAGKDGMVKYWDINSDTSLNTFSGHNEQINCIHFDELRIASASYDHKIRIWDFNI
ncbi:hypothetical protein LOTGIDRAFT_154278 [Lottia gigantea]|uniref:F-box domain-containing protein n=1 Tax=Lottia gigantea TaxID=225164 RepID=V4BKS1_LOTGI|nr:hypothetical protein LOTGIDRAFT_154278 [Lottia gigantea]ESO89189.1 hypothetical protein LOTGIDRAFT_154278 [Lottia gigantea]